MKPDSPPAVQRSAQVSPAAHACAVVPSWARPMVNVSVDVAVTLMISEVVTMPEAICCSVAMKKLPLPLAMLGNSAPPPATNETLVAPLPIADASVAEALFVNN